MTILDKEKMQRAYAEQIANVDKKLPGQTYSAFAETLIELVQPQHVSLDIFSAFMPVSTIARGTNIKRRAKRGRFPTRTLVPGTTPETSKLSLQEQTAFMFDRIVNGAKANLMELQSGDIGTVEDLRRELQADLTDDLVSKVFNLLIQVWNETDYPSFFHDATSGGVTQTVLDAMIEEIIDSVGGVRAIVGTRKALNNVYSFAGWTQVTLTGTTLDRAAFPLAALQEYFSTNRVSSYKGIPLVEMPQVRDGRLPDIRRKMIDTRHVLVIGEDVGQIYLIDGVQSQDYTDMRVVPADYVIWNYQEYAMYIDKPEGMGIIRVAAS